MDDDLTVSDVLAKCGKYDGNRSDFSYIVFLALEVIDSQVLADQFKEQNDTVRKWSCGSVIPAETKRHVIVNFIAETLAA